MPGAGLGIRLHRFLTIAWKATNTNIIMKIFSAGKGGLYNKTFVSQYSILNYRAKYIVWNVQHGSCIYQCIYKLLSKFIICSEDIEEKHIFTSIRAITLFLFINEFSPFAILNHSSLISKSIQSLKKMGQNLFKFESGNEPLTDGRTLKRFGGYKNGTQCINMLMLKCGNFRPYIDQRMIYRYTVMAD